MNTKQVLNSRVSIPRFFHEIHGRTQTSAELFLTYSAGIVAAIPIVATAIQAQFTLAQIILLLLLTLDIACGVVANCTEGTSAYYAESSSRRWVFLALHVVQPCLFIWLFPQEQWVILALGALTLASGCIVNFLQSITVQRVSAMTLLVLAVICMVYLIPDSRKILLLLMFLYSTKIILAFAVRWNER
jgi:hypothetical protein